MSDGSDRIQELQQDLEQVREIMFQSAKLAEMGKLVAVVAHELSQPLLGIKAFAQMAEEGFSYRRCQIFNCQLSIEFFKVCNP